MKRICLVAMLMLFAVPVAAQQMLLGVGDISRGGALSISYRETANVLGGSTTLTATGMDIGTASSDRIVAVTIATNSEAGETISSVTIGGVSATSAVYLRGGFVSSAIWYAAVTTGTTADVAVTYSAAPTYRAAFSTYSITGSATTSLSSVTSPDFGGFAGSYSVDVPANGVAVFLTDGASGGGADDTAWTNATKDFYVSPGSFLVAGGAHLSTISALTAYTVSVSGGSSTFGYSAVSASFGP